MIFEPPYFTLITYAIGLISVCIYINRLLSTDDLEPKHKYGCLECGSEYQPHIKFCYDCKKELENIIYFKFDEFD
jgi:hypothetical protein